MSDNFKEAMDYVTQYYVYSRVSASGGMRSRWFTNYDVDSVDILSYKDLLGKFDPSKEDAEATKTYHKARQSKKERPKARNMKHTRMRLLALNQLTQAVYRQYVAGDDAVQKGSVDTFRYVRDSLIPRKALAVDMKARVTFTEEGS